MTDLQRRLLLPGLAAAAVSAASPRVSAQVTRLRPNGTVDQSRELQNAIAVAMKSGGRLELPVGKFVASGLEIDGPLQLSGVPGQTVIVSPAGQTVLHVRRARHVTVSGLAIESGSRSSPGSQQFPGIVTAEDCDDLLIERCVFSGGAGYGFAAIRCSGTIRNNQFWNSARTGLFALDSRGMRILGNTVEDIGNNGIQVWTSEKQEDGTIVSGNRISRIGAEDGGSGQNGNGINIYRAGGVIVMNNIIRDCAFSGVRNNSGGNCQIIGNSIIRSGEVAIYVEFDFQGAVVSGNIVDDSGFGISMTNLDQGGRLASCTGNVIRNCRGHSGEGVTTAGGIAAEGDTTISGNTIENAGDVGVMLGWGAYCRNLAATGNVIRDCGRGVTVSVSDGAGPVLVANNIISGSRLAAISGMDHQNPVSAELGLGDSIIPPHILLSANHIR